MKTGGLAANIDFLHLFGVKKLLSGEKRNPDIEGKQYAWVLIDTRNYAIMARLAKRRLADFLALHPDNTLQMFQEEEIDRARQLQRYFSDYHRSDGAKEKYFAIGRYIAILMEMEMRKNKAK